MKREIKFRAWDNKAKEWLLGYEMPNLGGFSMFGEVMLMGSWSSVVNRFILNQTDRTEHDLILMQFTGLRDKNGKEIYENDILDENSNVFPVQWNSDDAGWNFDVRTARVAIVIGNEFEHPHFLS